MEAIKGQGRIRRIFRTSQNSAVVACRMISGEANVGDEVHIYRDGVEVGNCEVISIGAPTRGEIGVGLSDVGKLEESDILKFFNP